MRIMQGGISMQPRRRRRSAARAAPEVRKWPPTIGDNGGPPLDAPAPPWRGGDLYAYFAWAAACDAAWALPPYEIVMLRLRRAQALGMSYREYTLEILERGRYLQPGDRRGPE